MALSGSHPSDAPSEPPGLEEALLGVMLLDPRVVGTVIGVVKSPEPFASATNSMIFGCLVHLYRRGQTGDLIELAVLLREKACCRPEYVRRLVLNAPPVSTALDLAQQIADRHRRRKMGPGG